MTHPSKPQVSVRKAVESQAKCNIIARSKEIMLYTEKKLYMEKKASPWSFTIEFDEEKAVGNGYDADTFYDYVGRNAEPIGNVRISSNT